MLDSNKIGRNVLIAVVASAWLGCQTRPGANLSPGEVKAVWAKVLPTSPDDPAWGRVPVHLAKLIPQDIVEPRLMAPSTPELQIQALTDGNRIAFRLTWADATRDELPDVAKFTDACAIQLPAKAEADVPAPQMGETTRAVEIAYWSAVRQSSVDGRPDDIRVMHPNMQIDHYPFEATPLKEGSPERQAMALRYAPARAVGNPIAGKADASVEDLVATGPGTLQPAQNSVSTGKGLYTGKGWAVLIARPLPTGVGPGGRGSVAFAVWQGAAQEVGARKMRAPWIPLAVGKPL